MKSGLFDIKAIYILWLREMKKFFRMKSRLFGTLAMPLFFLIFLGFGLRTTSISGVPDSVNYTSFLVPGIVGMTMLFTSIFAGISLLWDREFGFLKEIMVAPVTRVSIVLGRIAGGLTTSLIQGILIILITLLLGFEKISFVNLLIAIVFMSLVSITFIGLGLIFASNMKDMQGFNIIMNFVIFPLFFLSGALFPLSNLPAWIRIISYLDPLTYGVDALRGVFIGVSVMPLAVNLAILGFSSLLMIVLGAYFFEKSEYL